VNLSATFHAGPCMLYLVQGGGLGLISNEDELWQPYVRESDDGIQARAQKFLQRIYAHVQEDIVFVVSHSGMIGAILAAIGREPYSATNAELVPALVEQRPIREAAYVKI
jgi:broad specificity phosphatase PhoE